MSHHVWDDSDFTVDFFGPYMFTQYIIYIYICIYIYTFVCDADSNSCHQGQTVVIISIHQKMISSRNRSSLLERMGLSLLGHLLTFMSV